MFAGSLVLAFTLFGFAGWLHWNEIHGWPEESFKTELDKQYHDRRGRARGRIHLIIVVCGVLILIAAFAGPGPLWAGCWMSVFVALVTVVILACFDFYRTHRYHQKKLPELKTKFLDDE
ncbi:MAG: hypothetical protein AB8B91_06030 [Rubripirellula sp.]